MNGGPTHSRPVAPLRLLIGVNLTQAARRLRGVVEQSTLLTGAIALFMAGYCWLAFALFQRALRFLASFPGFGELLVERLLFLLFALLFAMLLLSNLVIGYTNLFRNRETAFLWTLPVPAQSIYRWKFIETALLASWAFIFLTAPLLFAYGTNQRADWHFYAMTPALVALFIMLPAVAGAWLALGLARYIDRRGFQVITLTTLAVLLTLVAVWMRPEALPDEVEETRVLALIDRLLSRTEFAQFPFLPSFWLSSAVLQWTEGAVRAAGFFITVLLSNVLLFGFLSFTRLGGAFYDAASMVQSRGGLFGHWQWPWRRRSPRATYDFPVGPIERFFRRVPGLGRDAQALLAKDVRTFWRDTTQWAQTLVLFGLLGVYILNLRHFTQQVTLPFWLQLIAGLNLGACTLNLATLTTRFVYPQFSLEGRRLWIIGMAPMGIRRALRAKFWLALWMSLGVTLALLLLSCRLIQMPWERVAYFAAVVVVMAFTLNGLAIGLGALYPNLREDNPGKIVSGFGGTLCLVLSFLYVLATVILVTYGAPWSSFTWWLGDYRFICLGLFLALSFVLGWVPYRLGLRRVGMMEL
jgi:ABC-2 type transport system permease protein